MVPSPPADDDLDEVLGIAPPAGSSARHRSRRERRGAPPSAEPVRRWRSGDATGDPWDEIDDERLKARRGKRPVFWRARDSLYFEPLVALAILALLLVSLFAYTSNWPPVYVVESNSMQHGSGDHLGVLNAGDIVLAQKASLGSIVTYVDALRSGFASYGLLGDVILYSPNGSSSATPVIHRAIIYLQYDGRNDTYNATDLAGLSCGLGSSYDYYVRGTPSGCGTTGLHPGDNLTLYNVGGRTVNIDFAAGLAELGAHSGFLTLGDNNSYPDQLPGPGTLYPLSSLVEPGWVIGVARGMIPWFGALKLLLDGNAGKVPSASWEFLGLTIAGVIFAAAGVHILLRREREHAREERGEPPEEEPAREERAGPAAASPPARTGLRPWKAEEEPTDDKSAAGSGKRMSYEQRRRSHFVSSHEKRPKPGRRKGSTTSDDSDSSEPAS